MIGGKMYYPEDLEEYKRNMEGRRIYISNLSYETDWKQLKDHMRRAGEVVRVDIFQDEKGRSRGCGVVEYKTKEDC